MTAQAPEKEDWSTTGPAIVSEMRNMTKEALLDKLASLCVPAATELQADGVVQQELQQFTRDIRKAVAAAGIQARTNEARRTFQTILTAVAHDGGGGTSLTLKRKSELIGIHPDHLTAAGRRVQSLDSDAPPTEAISNNAYWFHPQEKRKRVPGGRGREGDCEVR